MAHFVVLGVCAVRQRVSLFDRNGRYHVAHSTGALPIVGTELLGTMSIPGPVLLLAGQAGIAGHFVFEAIDCSRQDTDLMLRPSP